MTALPMLAFLVALTGMATSAQPLVVRDTLVQVAGREVYIAMPPITQDGYRVVLALHGSGREARSYKPGDSKANAFYVRQRDLAVKNGYLFVVVSNGSDTWGTDRGLMRYWMPIGTLKRISACSKSGYCGAVRQGGCSCIV
ncbi:hypothetical protein SAMN05660226_04073 [Parapedobacter luteus]|uniref:Poly(3-hydroxybutyrate) depolymerase n=1 Tax=Parapedobacter luteus TaxID=623280 RepID=A0A1T5FLX4_9SPHI|nr:hypothetical protein SAMN05660226_04073 [Parapedobacter luteus]